MWHRLRVVGTLDVRVRGNTIIPQTILGRFWILCATLRQIHLILQITTLSTELRQLRPDAFFIDQLSAGVPLLRLIQPSVRVLFYCHFPDKLLVQRRGGIRRVYRWLFDGLESWSTGCADRIVVNSKFTRGVFKEAFPGLKHITPGVVYPCVDTSTATPRATQPLWAGKKVFLSINRFERKKDVGLAIRAFAGLDAERRRGCRLIIAGGYDPRNSENSSYHTELETLAASLKLKHATARTPPTALAIPAEIDVLFLLSVPSAFKTTLLSAAHLLVYTPRNEHFGIVPLEAMMAGTPVLAANEGGPVETVVEGQTGWLRNVSDVEAWTAVLEAVWGMTQEQLARIGQAGRERAQMFSKENMAETLDGEIDSMRSKATVQVVDVRILASLAVAFVAIALAILAYRFR